MKCGDTGRPLPVGPIGPDAAWQRVRRCPVLGYLLCGFIVSNICFDAEWPLDVDVVLVQLQQEHDQHEESVYHEERKHRRVPQLFQIRRDSGLRVMAG